MKAQDQDGLCSWYSVGCIIVINTEQTINASRAWLADVSCIADVYSRLYRPFILDHTNNIPNLSKGTRDTQVTTGWLPRYDNVEVSIRLTCRWLLILSIYSCQDGWTRSPASSQRSYSRKTLANNRSTASGSGIDRAKPGSDHESRSEAAMVL